MNLPTKISNWFRYATGTSPTSPKNNGDQGDYMRLENRIVYSAAPLGDLADLDLSQTDSMDVDGHDTDFAHNAFDAGSFDANELSALDLSDLELSSIGNIQDLDLELVFVDAQTDNYEQLLDDLRVERAGKLLEVVLIDSDTNGIDQISKALQGRSQLDAIHVISHGNETGLQLGDRWLNQDSLFSHSGEIALWGDALSSDGDILLYGCDLAGSEEGISLLESLASLTQADVAASDDITGHESLGGDWDFEFVVGDVDTNVVFSFEVQSSWMHSLDTIDVDQLNDTVNGDISSVSALLSDDGGDGISLREAIIAANQDPDHDEILVGIGTHTLTIAGDDEAGTPDASIGDLDLIYHVDIIGVDASNTIIASSTGERIFDVHSTDQINIQGLRLINGEKDGGAIYVRAGGDVEVLEADIRSNNQTVTASHGAIYAEGRLEVADSTIASNGTAQLIASGGGISVATNATVILDNVAMQGNEAGSGGAIVNHGVLEIFDSRLDNNRTNTTFGLGGGVWNASPTANLVVERTTMSNNLAFDGAAVYQLGGTAHLENVTISGNNALHDGGGIYAADDISLMNNTIAFNTANLNGDGIFVASGVDFQIQNTLLANVDDYFGNSAVNSSGGNIATSSVAGFNALDAIEPIGSLELQNLQNNGGFAPTHALGATSSALDFGNLAGAPTVDQRNFSRLDGSPDTGAFERNPVAAIDAIDDTYSITENSSIGTSDFPPKSTLLDNDTLSNPDIVVTNLTLNYDAALDTDLNNTWEDATNLGGFDFNLSAPPVSTDPTTSPAGITSAYVFDGTSTSTGTTNNLNGISGTPTNESASFEFWFRPADATIGDEVIFDTGDEFRGTSLIIEGQGADTILRFTVDLTTFAVTTTLNISTEVNSGEWIHAVGTIDIGSGSDIITLYATGQDGVQQSSQSGGFFNDWSENNEQIAIGGNNGGVAYPGSDSGLDDFEGEIAVFRFYDTLLDSSNVTTNYQAINDITILAPPQTTTSVAGVDVTIFADGSFDYDPGTQFDFLTAGSTAVDTFSYTAVNSNGDPDTATATISVLGVNDAPVITSDSTGTVEVQENTTQVTTVMSSDVDSGDTATYSIGGGADATLFTINPTTGVLTFNAAPDFEAPQPDNTYEVIVQATDPLGLTASQTLTVEVTDANEEPVNSGSIAVTLTEDDPPITPIDLLSVYTDPEGLTLAVSGVTYIGSPPLGGNPPGISVTGSILDVDPSAHNFLDDGDTQTVLINYDVSDGLNTVNATATVTITGVNDAPIANDDGGGTDPAFTTDEETAITLDVLANDTDPDVGDTLTIASVSSANNNAIVNATNTMITYDPSGLFDSLGAGQTATDILTYVVTDGTTTSIATATVTIEGVNDAPVIDTNQDLIITPGILATIGSTNLHTSDADAVHSAADLTYLVSSLPDAANGELFLNTVSLTTTMPFTQEDINLGNLTYLPTAASLPDSFNFAVSDGSLGALGTFHLSPTARITGFVFEDVNGDSLLDDKVDVEDAIVHLYEDTNNDGLIDAGDGHVTSTITASDGSYEFTVSGGTGNYFVVVDSTSIDAGSTTDVWAEQTYGTAGAMFAGNTGTEVRTDAGAAFGGRTAGVSDNAAGGLLTSEHVTLVSTDSGTVNNVDFGFSFNVVTNDLGGDLTDDDTTSSGRWVQGSLRQFIENANRISGDNEMRFTPVVDPTYSDGLESWWSIDVTDLLPEIVDAGTTIDGTAYDFTDGVSLRNTNTAIVGGDTTTVGTGVDGRSGTGDEASFFGVEGSELTINTTNTNLVYGLKSSGDATNIRDLTIHGFGDTSPTSTELGANIWIEDAFDITIERVVVGGQGTMTSAELANVTNGSLGDGIWIQNSSEGEILESVVVGSNESGIVIGDSSDWLIEGNEILVNAQVNTGQDGMDLRRSDNVQVRYNLIDGNGGSGIDTFRSDGSMTIEGNTIRNNGTGADEGAGIRLFGNNSLVTQNIIESNAFDGVLVIGRQGGDSAADENRISRNSFSDNGGLAIDLGRQNTDQKLGDGLNSIDDAYNNPIANKGIDRPIISVVNYENGSPAGNYILDDIFGDAIVEYYIASAPHPSDISGGTQFGEGETYLFTVEHVDTDSNGEPDTYLITHDSGAVPSASDFITAIAIDADGNTSEFSNVAEVNFAPVASDDTRTIAEDTTLAGNLHAITSDPDGDSLTYATTGSEPAGLQVETDGTFTYTPSPDFNGTVTFDYTVTDPFDLTDTATVTINVTPVNDEETVVNTGPITVNEHDFVSITADDLLITDVDNPQPSTLTYTIANIADGPSHGQLEFTTSLGTAVTSFTQADVDAGILIYRHNSGSEHNDNANPQPQPDDQIVFTIDDGFDDTHTTTLEIIVDNDPQQLVVDSQISLLEGTTQAITSTELLTTDTDDTTSQIVYTITTPTSSGYLRDITGLDVPISQFTQADIDAGNIRYVNTSNGVTSDFFDFSVDDQADQDDPTTGRFDFNIIHTKNTGMVADEGEYTPIDKNELCITDNIYSPSQFTYTIGTNSGPAHGQLELTTNPGQAITSFTQDDIDQDRLVYRHFSTSDPVTDAFDFTISNPDGEVTSGTFDIDIDNKEEQSAVNETLTVVEGAQGNITSSFLETTDSDDLPSELIYTITSTTTNGQIGLIGASGVLNPTNTFTQADIDDGSLFYQHDGTPTATDSFEFTVDDGQGSELTGTFNIDVQLVNDPPTITAPTQRVIAEDTPEVFSFANGTGITLTDPDALNSDVRLRITAVNGTVSLASSSGLTFVNGTGTDDGLVVIRGTIAELNAAIDGLTFTPDNGFTGDGEIRLRLNDLGNTGGGNLIAAENIAIEVLAEVDANDDVFDMAPGETSISGNVLDNDASLSSGVPVLITAEPSTGSFDWNNGNFTYTPDFTDPNFQETITLEYQITNGLETDTAILEINVPAPPIQTVDPEPDTDPADEDDDNEDIAPPPPSPTNAPPVVDNKVDSPTKRGDRDDSSTVDDELPPPPPETTTTSLAYDRATRSLDYNFWGRESVSNESDFQFETGAYEITTNLGEFSFRIANSTDVAKEMIFSTEFGSWHVPTGLALTGGLSVGWVIWSLNSGYILGSLLSTLSPWTLIDPLPVLDTVGPATTRDDDESEDKLERMVD